MTKYFWFTLFFSVNLFLLPATARSQPSHIVCAVGDSHVVPGSYFLRVLQEELGEEYEIRAEGRRGWTSRRWIRSGDFAEVCEGADIVLVSLGGNDRVHGRTWRSIKENVSTLVESLPSGTHVFHMTVPRYYRPRIHLASDGIHMSRRGAREYARVVAPMLLMRVAD